MLPFYSLVIIVRIRRTWLSVAVWQAEVFRPVFAAVMPGAAISGVGHGRITACLPEPDLNSTLDRVVLIFGFACIMETVEIRTFSGNQSDFMRVLLDFREELPERGLCRRRRPGLLGD